MKSSAQSSSTLVLLTIAVFLPSCASSPAPPPPSASTVSSYEEGVPGGSVVDTVDVTARVKAIDAATRKLTLLGPDGNTFKVKVGPAAVNFDQIQVGDLVTATVTRQLVVAMGDAVETQPDGSAAMVALAPVGAKPGGIVAGTTRVTGTVTAIDPDARTATLAFEDGSSRTFPVRPDIDLSKRSVGEKVVFQVTEMVAIDVQEE
jgi:hypothetical protein